MLTLIISRRSQIMRDADDLLYLLGYFVNSDGKLVAALGKAKNQSFVLEGLVEKGNHFAILSADVQHFMADNP